MSQTALKVFARAGLFALICLFLSTQLQAQSVGVGTQTPDPNAILHVVVPDPSGNPQGLIMPQLNTAQRTSMTLSGAQEGLVVYDNTDSTIYAWTGNVWQPVGSGGVTPWSVSGNYLFTTTDSVGIGVSNPSERLHLQGNILLDGLGEVQFGNASVNIRKNVTEPDMELRAGDDIRLNAGDDIEFSGQEVRIFTNGGVQYATFNSTTQSLRIGTGPATQALDVDGNIAADSLVIYNGTNPPSAGDVLMAIDASGKTYWGTPAVADYPVDSVRAGTGISVSYTNDTAIVALTTSGVSAGNYGSSTNIPQITVDAQGRITSATNVPFVADSPIDSVRAGNGVLVTYLNDTAVVSLPNVGTPGTYGTATTIPRFTTDDQGRITSVTSVTIPTVDPPIDSVRAGNGLLVNYLNDTAIVSMPDVGTAGTYGNSSTIPQFTTDAQGRITSVNSIALPTVNTPVDSVRAGNGLTVNYLNDTAIVAMPNVGTAGTYGNASIIPQITTDAQGRVVSVNSISVPGANFPVDSVRAGTGLSVTYLNDTAIVSMPNVGTAGTYGSGTIIPRFTTDAQGRVTSVTGISIPATDTPVDSVRAGNGLTVNYLNDTAIVAMPNVGTAGTYGNATTIPRFTTDAQGRITNVSSISIPTVDTPIDSVRAGNGLTVNYLNDTAIVAMPNVGTAGTYGNATTIPRFTTDAQGRITSVTGVSIPMVDTPIDSVRAGNGLTVTYLNDTAIVSMPNVGTAGTYGSVTTIPQFTTDAQGRVTGVTGITLPTTNFPVDSVRAGAGMVVSYINDTAIVSLPNIGTAGTYGASNSIPQITTDAQGRITSVTNITLPTTEIPVDSVRGGTGVNVTYLNDTAIVNLANTAVTPGDYGTTDSVAVFTVDAQGRIRSASQVKISGQGDTLGNHVMSQNLRTGSHYISSDGDAEGLFINGTGQVGIGHNNPTEQLHLSNASLDQTIFVQTGTNNRSAEVLLQTSQGTNDHLQLVKHGPTSGGTTAGVSLNDLSRVATGSTGGPLMLQVISNNNMHFVTGNQERMRILGNGNVGIGQLNPQTRLHVDGVVRIEDFGSSTNEKLVIATGNGNLDTIAFTGNNNEVLLGNATFGTITGDNLGNHTMTSNLRTGANFISNDGTNTGIGIDASNHVSIGLGNGATAPGIHVRNNGDIAIGHNAPATKVHMRQNGSFDLRIEADADNDDIDEVAYIELLQHGGASSGYLGLHGSANSTFQAGQANALMLATRTASQVVQVATNDTARVTIDQNGLVGIGVAPSGTYTLEVNGTLGTTGINEMSDQRWKEHIETIEGALDQVLALRGVTYDWRFDEFPDRNFSRRHQVGLIAQEVEKVVPELVDTDVNGFKTVQYSKIVALLIEGMKEQNERISRLEKQAEGMELMKAEINQIKLQLNNGVGSK